MSFSLPPHAIAAANTYFNSFTKKTRTKGEEEFRNGRVISVEAEGENHFVATVGGKKSFEADLFFEKGEWSGVCDCSSGDDCQHCYAALRKLVASAAPEEADLAQRLTGGNGSDKSADPKNAGLRHALEQKLGRPLSEQEVAAFRAIQTVYTDYRSAIQVPGAVLAPLTGKPKGKKGWQEHQLWPSMPRSLWETWLYIAHFLRTQFVAWPEFLAATTEESEVDALVADWLAEQREEAADEASDAEEMTVHLRAILGPRDIRLECREAESTEWALVKKSRFDRLADAAEEGTLTFGDTQSEKVWDAFSMGILENGTMSYTAPESAPALNNLLRNPQLDSHVLSAGGEPLERASERLSWRLEKRKSAGGEYELTLTNGKEKKPAAPIATLDGLPALYLTADTLYEAPPLGGLSVDPTTPTVIPAASLETPEGVALLDKIGLPLPEQLASRVKRYRARLVIEAWLEDTPREEYLMIKFRGEWDGTAPDEVLMQPGWVTAVAKNGARGPAAKPASAIKHAPDAIVCRDRTPLRPAASLASQISANWNSIDQAWVRPLGRNFPEQFSDWLLALPADADLRLDPALASLREKPISAGVRLDIEPSGVDWFDVRAVLDVPDVDLTADELRELLDAGGGWVRLGEDGWRKLALRWGQAEEEQLADLGLSTGDLSGEPQRLHTLQLATERATRLMHPDSAEEVRRRAAELRARVDPPVPGTIQAELRPYQVEGYHFLAYLSANNFGGVLADDMGLGKTLQTLTWMAFFREQSDLKDVPSLVVCPKSVVANWQAEAARFLPGMRVHIWSGGDENELAAVLRDCDLLVLNYVQLRLQSAALVKHSWHAVILDEAQAIKNPDSQTARTACALKAAYRLAVTGTPLENRLLDLWSIFNFAMPGILGARARFAKEYDAPGDNLARRRLSGRVRPFLLRRTKKQVARDLPARTEEDLLCELEDQQKTLYRAELKRARMTLLKIKTSKELDKQRFNVLTSLLRLRQICCHPALIDKKHARANSAKLEALLEMLEPLMEEGHKVLVFSQFVAALDIIGKSVDERGWRKFVLTGETENRGALVKDFQSTEGAAVFLLSLKAGGAGLNLTAASYVVLFDPWWNPAVENQAIDRTHRIGQTQQVNAYRLLMRGTIEEKIRTMQREKNALADDVLGEEAFARGLTLDDLNFLFEDESGSEE